jgi:ATP-dependent DNA helicase RecG
VHVRIFDNRIEVESPGKLAGPVTVKNILTQRFARNKKIVRLIAKFPSPPNKDVGEGLNTTFRSMQKLNLGKPEISETASSVLVRLKHEPLASKEELIRQYLSKNGSINNTTARKVCNVESDSVIRKLFKGMIDAGELEKIPETRGKGTKYRIPVAG